MWNTWCRRSNRGGMSTDSKCLGLRTIPCPSILQETEDVWQDITLKSCDGQHKVQSSTVTSPIRKTLFHQSQYYMKTAMATKSSITSMCYEIYGKELRLMELIHCMHCVVKAIPQCEHLEGELDLPTAKTWKIKIQRQTIVMNLDYTISVNLIVLGGRVAWWECWAGP